MLGKVCWAARRKTLCIRGAATRSWDGGGGAILGWRYREDRTRWRAARVWERKVRVWVGKMETIKAMEAPGRALVRAWKGTGFSGGMWERDNTRVGRTNKSGALDVRGYRVKILFSNATSCLYK
jgi:hypothetical protein